MDPNKLQDLQRRDALTMAFYALRMADPNDRKEIDTAQRVVNQAKQLLPAARVNECKQLADEMADIEHFWEET